ncbi:calcium uniporter protein, mitochondrial isoform X2 [Planococcus citri]|uniref:calcium uniporter protein, mitochondrial isoform X2 n=1 Tax=Planococcus citri TaxID=170843 RepID=UPI0031F918E8
MAVRGVVTRYNYLLIDVNRVLNIPLIHHRSNVKKLHCCRSRNHWRCFSDDRSRILSSFVPRRHLTQDANERVPSSGSSLPETTGAEEKKEDHQITIDYYRGLPRITVPLPSRNEKCRFTLKPISNTVGDLTSMIQQEDRGIDRVVLSTKDGVRIASSCSIEILLQEEEVYVTINDKRYRIEIPTAIRKSFTKDDLEKLSEVRILISQLYETLNVKEYHVMKEQELMTKLEKIQSSLQPLEEQRALLEKKAGNRTSVLTWVGLSMMGVQFGVLARLTWWEYSWDIMEPVTYFVTYGTAMATYAYFALTKQDYILPEIRDRQHLLTLHKKANKLGFDLHQYNSLRDQLALVKTDLDRLRDPLIPPQKLSKLYSHPSETSGDLDVTRQPSALDQIKTYMTVILNKTKKS